MKKDYNGVIRQLLKEFLNEMSQVIRTVIDLREDQKIGYLLAIFETHIVDRKI